MEHRAVGEKARVKAEEALQVAETLRWLLEPACDRIEIAGSLRRQLPDVGDLELLVIPRRQGDIDGLDRAVKRLIFNGVLNYRRNKRGSLMYGPKNKLLLHVASSIAVDIFSSTEANWGMALFIRTGPQEWNIKAMTRFRQLGMRGHAYGGISLLDGREVNCPDEETVFRYLGWPYSPPERRA